METIGSLIDKLSINELKIYHMNEQKDRTDKGGVFREDCKKRLSILLVQKEELSCELQKLMDDVRSGKHEFKVYRQMKMYNEKKFKD